MKAYMTLITESHSLSLTQSVPSSDVLASIMALITLSLHEGKNLFSPDEKMGTLLYVFA